MLGSAGCLLVGLFGIEISVAVLVVLLKLFGICGDVRTPKGVAKTFGARRSSFVSGGPSIEGHRKPCVENL